MAVPQAVLDVLNSFRVPGVPSSMNPGDVVKLQVTPNPLTAFDFLAQPQTLADINLAVLLDKIDLKGLAASADADIVLEAVEFPKPAEKTAGTVSTTKQAVGDLPHLIPTVGGTPQISVNVEGLLGKLNATVAQTGDLAGSLAGSIVGTITRKVLGAPPEVTVQWRVEDANGKALGSDRVVLDGATTPTLSIVFLPEFVELTGRVEPPAERRIFCDLRLALPGEQPTPHTLGPFTVAVPRVAVPTVLLMTLHGSTDADAFPGAILIAVPASSALSGVDSLVTVLKPIQTIFKNLALVAAATFGEAAGILDTIKTLLHPTAWVKLDTRGEEDKMMDLWTVEREPPDWTGIFGRKSFEDCISGLFLIGPPGRAITVHNKKYLWVGDGAFSVTLGPTAVAAMPDFFRAPAGGGGVPAIAPASSTAGLIVAAKSPPGTFNDVVSSFRFLPLT